jgi:hypothetical protein
MRILVLALCLSASACVSRVSIETPTHTTTTTAVNIPFFNSASVTSESKVHERPMPEPLAMPPYACLPGTWCGYYGYSYPFPQPSAPPPSPTK